MKKILLFLFDLYNNIIQILQEFSYGLEMLGEYFTKNIAIFLFSLKVGLKSFVSAFHKAFVNFFVSIWKFLKWVTYPFRKALYEYVVFVFFACLFITFKYPEWEWTDYTWLVFYFILMITLLIAALKDK